MGLQMDIPGAGRRSDVVHGLRIARVAHIDNAEPLGEHMTDVGVAVGDHDLHAIRSPALIGKADQTHVTQVVGPRQIDAHR
jgi:hypothetical protein